MSELIQNTARLVERFNDEIKSDLSSKNIDNSGTASNSIRIDVDEHNLKVRSLGIGYMHFLNVGRAPGKFPPVSVIVDWVNSKPVEINPFLVGRKIAREGTEIFKNRSKGIMLDEKRDRLLREINERAPKWAKQDLLILIKKGNQKLNK